MHRKGMTESVVEESYRNFYEPMEYILTMPLLLAFLYVACCLVLGPTTLDGLQMFDIPMQIFYLT